jgi:hypothetical protein
MNSLVNVGRYFDKLVKFSGNTARFAGNFVGFELFLPDVSEISIIETIREDDFKDKVRSYMNSSDLAYNVLDMIEDWLTRVPAYHYQAYYIKNAFGPISYNPENPYGRLEIIDNLAHDLSMWDLVNYLHDEKAQFSELADLESDKLKLDWLGTPSQLGFIISELAKKGFIKVPQLKNGKPNMASFERAILNCFDGDFGKGVVYQAISEFGSDTNKLVDSNKAKFVIPERSDLS